MRNKDYWKAVMDGDSTRLMQSIEAGVDVNIKCEDDKQAIFEKIARKCNLFAECGDDAETSIKQAMTDGKKGFAANLEAMRKKARLEIAESRDCLLS